jgi:putative flippase GtrA
MDFIKFFKFGLVGCSGLVIDFSITWICKEKLLINKYISNVLGFIFAVTSNYFLNKYFTFQDTNNHLTAQFLSFLIISIIGLLLSTSFLYLLQKYTKLNFYLCKAIVTLIVFFWNFSANSLYTFKA